MRHYYAEAGDFSNRYTVACFETAKDRDDWLQHELDSDNVQGSIITRAKARQMLGDNYLSPGDGDYRTSLGCYLGSRAWAVDDYRREVADADTREEEAKLDVTAGIDIAFARPIIRL